MMFDTKIAIGVCEDLATWQKLNVTAFLMSGIVGAAPEIVGEPYRDAAGNVYSSLSIQPVIVLAADRATLSSILAIDGTGAVLTSLQDPDGTYRLTTGATEAKDHIYIGSLTMPVLGRLPKANAGL